MGGCDEVRLKVMVLRLVSCLLILYCLSACQQVSVNAPNKESLIDSIHVLDDAKANSNFAEIQRLGSTQQFTRQEHLDRVDIRSGNSVIWVKPVFSQQVKKNKNYILEVGRPTLDKVSVYKRNVDGSWKTIKTGDSVVFHNREIIHEKFLFKISGPALKKFKNSIFLKIQNQGITSSTLKLLEESEFHHDDQQKSLLAGLYFGVLVALLIFNLLIFVSVRDVSYLWYVGYLGFILLFLFAYSGLTYRYLWPENPGWANRSTYFALMTSMALGLGFTRSMFNLTELFPILSSFLKSTGMAIALLAVFGLFVDNTFSSFVTPYLALLVILIILLAIVKAVMAAYKPAYYAGLGFIFLFAGSMMVILNKVGVLPSNVLSEYGLHLGVLFEAFLLSFALAYRINYINEELKLSNQIVMKARKQFSSRLIDFQDQERKETSATLHDSFGQKLLVIKIQLAQILESYGIQEDDSKVKSITGLIHEVIDDVRDISHALHPHQIERLTLKEALEDVIFQSFRDTGLKYIYDLNGLEECIDSKSKLHIYRIFQESINNILKHSEAKNVEFKSRVVNQNIEIIIKDDGKGVVGQSWFNNGDFVMAHGISNIRERVSSLNGSIHFESGQRAGLEISIKLACKKEV